MIKYKISTPSSLWWQCGEGHVWNTSALGICSGTYVNALPGLVLRLLQIFNLILRYVCKALFNILFNRWLDFNSLSRLGIIHLANFLLIMNWTYSMKKINSCFQQLRTHKVGLCCSPFLLFINNNKGTFTNYVSALWGRG